MQKMTGEEAILYAEKAVGHYCIEAWRVLNTQPDRDDGLIVEERISTGGIFNRRVCFKAEKQGDRCAVSVSLSDGRTLVLAYVYKDGSVVLDSIAKADKLYKDPKADQFEFITAVHVAFLKSRELGNWEEMKEC